MAGARSSIGLRLLALLAALLFPTLALAHATLVGSSPGDGGVVSEAPKSFRLDFNEPVAVTGLRLSGGGRTVQLDGFQAIGPRIEIEAPSDLAAGSYALSYRVVSEDGHPISGAVSFAVGAPSAGPALELDPANPTLDAAIWVARLVLYLGLLIGAGGAFAIVWLVEGHSGRKPVVAALGIGLVAAPVAFALQGADLVGASLSGTLDPLAWRQALTTTYAWAVLAAAISLTLGIASLACRDAAGKVLSAAALCGVGVAMAASGHASVAAPQALMRFSVFIHGVGAAFWIGALIPLLMSLKGDCETRALMRFSATASYAVAALVLAGGILAVRQVETVPALWTTSYGLVLSSKLALVAVLFALAAANRWRWTGPAAAGDPGARRSLHRSVGAELVVGAVILGVVALWRFTPPPRALAIASAEPAVAHLQTRVAQADVTISPGRVGKSDITVTVMTGDFGPLDAKQLTVVLSNAAAGVEPIRREALKPGDGTWRVEGLQIPAAGQWTVRLEILVTDFDVERLDGRIDVRP